MSNTLLFVFALFAACAFAGEPCADNVVYELKGDTLTISGTGAMTDYSATSPAPWNDDADDIVHVVIGDGVTTVGEFAFNSYANLESVTLPDSLLKIGKSAFYYCQKLSGVVLPNGLTTIGSQAFQKTNITSIVIPASLETLGLGIFSFCENLYGAIYMGDKTFDGVDIFTGSSKLKSVCVPVDYNMTHFCECCNEENQNTCYKSLNKEGCDTFKSMYTICSKADYIDGVVQKVKRPETVEWESQSENNLCYDFFCSDKTGFGVQKSNLAKGWEAKNNGCMEYTCINETGGVRWSKCNTTDTDSRLCMSDYTCVTNWRPTLKDKWWVEIVFDDNTLYGDTDDLEIATRISTLATIKRAEISIYFEIDTQGNALRAAVKVKDEKSAKAVKSGVETVKKEAGCRAAILCSWEEVILHEKETPKTTSSSVNAGVSVHGMSGVMALFLLLASVMMW